MVSGWRGQAEGESPPTQPSRPVVPMLLLPTFPKTPDSEEERAGGHSRASAVHSKAGYQQPALSFLSSSQDGGCLQPGEEARDPETQR